MTQMKRGILTIAYGAPKYLRMGRALALSIRHHNDEEQIAVVTDTPGYFEDTYDHVIPVDTNYGTGVTQKLHLDRYTPFKETLFIDSDCLLYGTTERLWDFFSVEKGIGVRSVRPLTHGDTCHGVRDFDRYLDYFDLKSIPNLKGGFYYFDGSDEALEVFETARDIYAIREDVELTSFKNAAVADEAVIGTAMELCGADPLPIDSAPVNTFIGETEPVDLNVLEGKSRFIKSGLLREPIAIHYGLNTQEGYLYLRDVRRLELKEKVAAEWRARITGRSEATRRWLERKWQNIERRTEAIGPLGILPGRFLRRLDVEGLNSQ
jgi:hypothetical protein